MAHIKKCMVPIFLQLLRISGSLYGDRNENVAPIGNAFPDISQSSRIIDPSYKGPRIRNVTYSKVYLPIFYNRHESAIFRMGATQQKCCLFESALFLHFAIVMNHRFIVWGPHSWNVAYSEVRFSIISQSPWVSDSSYGAPHSWNVDYSKVHFSYIFAIALNQRPIVWGHTSEMSPIWKCDFPTFSQSSWIIDPSYGWRTSEMSPIQKCAFPIFSQSSWISDPSYGGPHSWNDAYSKVHFLLYFRNRPELAN